MREKCAEDIKRIESEFFAFKELVAMDTAKRAAEAIAHKESLENKQKELDQIRLSLASDNSELQGEALRQRERVGGVEKIDTKKRNHQTAQFVNPRSAYAWRPGRLSWCRTPCYRKQLLATAAALGLVFLCCAESLFFQDHFLHRRNT